MKTWLYKPISININRLHGGDVKEAQTKEQMDAVAIELKAIELLA